MEMLELSIYSYGISAFFLALVVQCHPCQGATLHPHPNCDGTCGETDPVCRSKLCTTEWDSCPQASVQNGESKQIADTNNSTCYQTDCSPGGCPEGFQEIYKEPCFDLDACPGHVGFCNREKCCPLRTSVECCPLLPCNVTYEGCEIPQQSFLSDPSRSAAEAASFPHGQNAAFPFYKEASVIQPEACDTVRVWGRCFCDDGHNLPGCEPSNSSSWYLRIDGPQTGNATAAAATILDPDLSVTCVVLPAVLADNSTMQGGGGSGGGGAQQQHSQLQGGSFRGSMVALILLGSLLLAGCTTFIVLWCCGMLPDLHKLRILNLTTYEPVFTGQSYTPSMGSSRRHASTPDNTPWTRFCTAVTETGRRLLYGKRYVEESASAAAAAERYRTLNELGRFRGGGGRDEEAVERGWPPGKPIDGQVVLPSYRGRRGGKVPQDEDLEVDEVFTLDDLGTATSDVAMGSGASWRLMGQQLPVSRSATAAAAAAAAGSTTLLLPTLIRASSSVSSTAAAAALSPSGPLHGHSISNTTAATTAIYPEQFPRPRLNQFGLSQVAERTEAGGHLYGGGGGVSGGGRDVIHTRPLKLTDGGDGEDDEGPPDVDAPLRWLPSPQITGQ